MRILLLTHAFNSLTQRIGAELRQRGHEVSVEFDISDSVTEEALAWFAPELIVAPYLRRAIPESVWMAPTGSATSSATWQDIAYEEADQVGYLHFEFYNGALSTQHCERLRAALAWAKQRPTRVLVFMGGHDFWSNGIHLNVIEAAGLGGGSAADESGRNINAMNDLALELITTEHQITVAAVGGNTDACLSAWRCGGVSQKRRRLCIKTACSPRTVSAYSY